MVQRNFEEINGRFNTQDQTLHKILEQAMKTNGRVSALEGWRGYITGGLTVVVIILVPLLLNILKK